MWNQLLIALCHKSQFRCQILRTFVYGYIIPDLYLIGCAFRLELRQQPPIVQMERMAEEQRTLKPDCFNNVNR